MNRREHRGQWLARHRGDASAGSEVGVAGTPRREVLADGHAVRDAKGHPAAARVESHTALRLAKQAVGSLRLHIEEVILHGFDPRGRYAIGDSVHQELTRLMTERGMPSLLDAPRSAERLDAGTFRVTPNSRPQALGTEVARSVYGGLKR